MTEEAKHQFLNALQTRYADAPNDLGNAQINMGLVRMAGRGSCRQFLDDPVPEAWVNSLCAVALASPTKSDLQQRDIVILHSVEKRHQLASLVSDQTWIADAPLIVVFCGNNRRQRLTHEWRQVAFANDHLDAFFNATADAAIALGAFVTAAEAMGLGCCPISAVRNQAEEVAQLLELPDHVFPVAGLALGFPAQASKISKRLPLSVTCHVDRYTENQLHATMNAYDEDRATSQPYDKQRLEDVFGHSADYCWSEDKVRQYSQAERADFGAFVRKKGFSLE